jgi:hypothetical protein
MTPTLSFSCLAFILVLTVGLFDSPKICILQAHDQPDDDGFLEIDRPLFGPENKEAEQPQLFAEEELAVDEEDVDGSSLRAEAFFGAEMGGNLLPQWFSVMPGKLKLYMNIVFYFFLVFLCLLVNQYGIVWSAADYLVQMVGLLMLLLGIEDFPKSFQAMLHVLHVLSPFRNVRTNKLDTSKLSLVKCKSCASCYTYEQCVKLDGNKQLIKSCCDIPLLIPQFLSRGKVLLRPNGKEFIFPGLIKQLPVILKRPSIREVRVFVC